MTLKRLFLALVLLLLLPGLGRAAEPSAPATEEALAAAVLSPQPTVIHFWAPWCPNCRSELASDGWKSTIEANPNVHFVFVTVWSDRDGRVLLAKRGIGGQRNVTLLWHREVSKLTADRVRSMLGQPLSWIPATWIYKDGKLSYAFNYGEMHFPILQQSIADLANSWTH